YAVLGGGFAGISVAWHLLQHCSKTSPMCIEIYDEVGLGGGASGVSGGLLHPYSPKGKLLWNGRECWEEALKLLRVAEAAVSTESQKGENRSANKQQIVAEPIVWRRSLKTVHLATPKETNLQVSAAQAWKIHEKTRSRARKEGIFEYLHLSPGRERRGRRIQRSPSPPRRTLSTPPPARPFFQSARILKPIRMAQPNPYVNFTGSSPLALIAQNPVPIAALKSIPYFTGENQTSLSDHVQDIVNVCTIHEIHEMDIAVKLLASSFKGKVSQWFRSLTTGSIQNWNQLCTALCDQFGEKGDNLSLLEQVTMIKRAPNEQLTNFNLRFQRTWDRIPTTVKPTNEGAFLYFLRALNSDISLMI
ncbi:hypothetical protein KI387_028663, partial [Taxus chinensis]